VSSQPGHGASFMSQHNSKRQPIELLAEEFLAQQRQGLSPSVEEYAATYPRLADQVRDLFPTLSLLENWKFSTPIKTSRPSTVFPHPTLTDFQILREIGRGGMGIVYEAIQKSLGRRIALKVLPHQVFFDNKKLKRFRREARAAGALNHPNIVTIHSVGHQNGLHYIVMHLVEGMGLDVLVDVIARNLGVQSNHHLPTTKVHQSDPLAEALAAALLSDNFSQTAKQSYLFQREIAKTRSQNASCAENPTVAVSFSNTLGQPSPEDSRSTIPPLQQTAARILSAMGDTYWRSVARVIQQAASALAHAHTTGTLHRDIKPANLMIDRAGVMWVTDVGLAKAMEENDVSRSGELVGTLRYMAPEQLRGVTDTRSDLYSLGLTLYELICFRPAFCGRSQSELIGQITRGSPATPRSINPSIPSDLEAIVLKAIAESPKNRYQTGEEFTMALQRFLGHHSLRTAPLVHVQNQRETTCIKWNWSSLTTAVLSLSVAIIVGGIMYLMASSKRINASVSTNSGDEIRSTPTQSMAKHDRILTGSPDNHWNAAPFEWERFERRGPRGRRWLPHRDYPHQDHRRPWGPPGRPPRENGPNRDFPPSPDIHPKFRSANHFPRARQSGVPPRNHHVNDGSIDYLGPERR